MDDDVEYLPSTDTEENDTTSISEEENLSDISEITAYGNSNSDEDVEMVVEMNVINCTEDDYCDIVETVYQLIDIYRENTNVYSSLLSPFCKKMTKDISDYLFDIWVDADIYNDDDDDEYTEIHDLVASIVDVYLDSLIQSSTSSSTSSSSMNIDTLSLMTTKLDLLCSIPQPKQRSKEWYEFRYQLLTASNVWKAVSPSQCSQNSLIYEKCKPLVIPNQSSNGNNGNGNDTSYLESRQINTNSPLHWGVKYEPLSVMIYEDLFQTKVGDFGCIQHPKYSFLGASPDGINIDPSNPVLYGRMLEIKNIVNRPITGIPKEEYWVQTQVQMETCDLDTCDFFETRFKEFVDADAFYQCGAMYKYKGIILYFVQNVNRVLADANMNADLSIRIQYDNSPKYVYMPLSIDVTSVDAIQQWITTTRESMKPDYLLYMPLYWYLDEYSCVLIERNRTWFQTALPKISDIWQTILKERVDGFEHRAPTKRKKRVKQILMSP